MKTCLLACLACAPAVAYAQPVLGPYVQLGGGVDILQNVQVRPSGFGPVPRDYTFDPGGSAFASAGYGFGNGLRIEAEGEYAYDHVHGVELSSQYLSARAGGHLQQYGGFGNVLYDLRLGLPVKPYLGLGLGYQEIELDQINSTGFGVRSGHLDYGEVRGNFAYQGIAGAAIATPWRGLSLTVEYRMIGVVSPDAYYRGMEIERVPIPVANQATFGTAASFRSIPPRPAFREVEVSEHATFNNIFNHEILFGLRYTFNNRAPAVPTPAPVTAEAPAPAPARTYLVFFDWDSAILTPRASDVVAQAAQNAARVGTTTIEVDGYADTSHALPDGSGQRYNLRLSLRRAGSVRTTLIRDGVAASAITVHGFGDARLLVPTGPDVREPQNRRVEIVLR